VGSCLVGLLGLASTLSGQERQRRPGGYGAVYADTTRSGYDQRGFGGPSSVGATLEFDNQEKGPFWRVSAPALASWDEVKRRANDNLGLQFGMTYQMAFVEASDGVSDSAQTRSSGGVVNATAAWTLVGRKSENPGSFTVMVENRHVYGSFETSPQNLAFETGSIIPTATKFGEMTTRVLVMYWGQVLLNGRMGVVAGKIAPDDYFNHHRMVHPFLNYMGYGSVITPTANWPNPGFGVAAGATITPSIYVKVGVNDAQGDPYLDGDFLDFGDDFFHGRFFTTAEIGWVPTWAERFVKRIAITAFHGDAYEGSAENYGVSAVTNWTFGSWVPFLLTGWSNGEGANVTASTVITGGVGYTMRSHDVAGVSYSWARPGGDGLRDQTTIEGFWRFFLMERVALTPNVQWVLDPALNPERSSLYYIQFRARVDL
jgi:porin